MITPLLAATLALAPGPGTFTVEATLDAAALPVGEAHEIELRIAVEEG